MKVDVAFAVAALVVAASIADLSSAGSRSVSSQGSRRKVEASVDEGSWRVTSHSVKRRDHDDDPWEDECDDSITSEIERCFEAPYRDYLPLCTALTAVDCNMNGVMDHHEINCGAVDSDYDGILDSCELAVGDFNLDGVIDDADTTMLLALWGTICPPYGDLNSDGTIDAVDLGILLGRFGAVVY
ncbi:MAG: Dockerin type domain [Planctomycetota bacterium]|jgi:hypothetical protein